MKTRISISLLLFLLAFNTFSQSFEGMRYLGGNGAFGVRKSPRFDPFTGSSYDYRSDNFHIHSKYGWFTNSNFLIGVQPGLAITRFGKKYDDRYEHSFNVIQPSIGAFSRYYFGNNFFLGLGTTQYFQISDVKFYNSNSNLTNISIGFPIFLNKNIAIEPELSYSFINFSKSGPVNLGVNLGVYLPQKKKSSTNEKDNTDDPSEQQISKGKSMVSGSLSSSTSTSGTNINDHFLVHGSYGYLLTDQFMISGGIALTSLSSHASEFIDYNGGNQWGVGLAPRYFITNNFFTEIGASLFREKFEIIDGSDLFNPTLIDAVYRRNDYYLAFGKALFITEQVAFEPMIGYSFSQNYYITKYGKSDPVNYLKPFAQLQIAYYFGGK